MKNISICINAKPISVNKAYLRNKQYSPVARKFRALFLVQLQQYEKEMRKFSSSFDPIKEELHLSIILEIPKDKFYTKTGSISRRSLDVDNCLKLPIDFLLNAKYNTDWLNDLCKSEREMYNIKQLHNVCIDDQYINNLWVNKRPGSRYKIRFNLSIHPLTVY